MGAFHLQSSLISPLMDTPVRLFIHDVTCLKHIGGTKTAFLLENHPFSNVSLIGIVTKIKFKEGVTQCLIDDGTGSIWCFCKVRPKLDSGGMSLAGIGNPFIQRLKEQSLLELGNIIQVQGGIKQGMWNNSIYLTDCKWSVTEHNSADILWVQQIQEQIALCSHVYSIPFELTHKIKSAAKSVIIQNVYVELVKLLVTEINWLFAASSQLTNFYGFELLNMIEVKSFASTFYSNIILRFQENNIKLSRQDRKRILYNAVVEVLQFHVTQGSLIRKKCPRHQMVTNNDQMDSHYFVSIKCVDVLKAVKAACDRLKNENINPNTVLQEFGNIHFNHLKSSKHGMAVMKTVLEYLCMNEDMFKCET